MNVQSQMVAHAVNVVRQQGFAVLVFSVTIDVLAGDILQIFALAVHPHPGLHRVDRGVLRAENNLVNFPLAGGELSVGR